MLSDSRVEADDGGPPTRSPVIARTLAWVLLGVIFWIDSVTPPGVGDPVLYVAPVLLFLPAGFWWEPLVVAVGASALTLAGVYVSPTPEEWTISSWNRPLAMLAIWITALLVSHHRRTLARWNAQVQAERRVREQSRARLEEIRQALDQAAIVATTDQRGIITYVNDKFCEISGFAREELLGQDHRIINSRYHPKEFFRNLWGTIAQGKVWRGEVRNRAKDGTIYWVDTTIVPFLDERGKPRQYLAIRSDVTQRKVAEAQLMNQASLAQLGQLAAVVAHEVRNPLAGVRGTLQVLRMRPAIAEQDRRIMDAMIERMDVLNDKVGDLLRFSKPRTPSLVPIDLHDMLADVVHSARSSMGRSAPEVLVSGDAAVALADAEMLRAVLLNLTLNACQASAGAPVHVTVVPEPETCRIVIADRGPGIAPDELDHVFEAFHTTKKSGTGLGLAIVKRYIELQNGRVRLDPREGGGTIAEVTVPRAPSRPATVAASVLANNT
ncbi:MAG: ATP-binding protein [Vicinamibacterales bacterium]